MLDFVVIRVKQDPKFVLELDCFGLNTLAFQLSNIREYETI